MLNRVCRADRANQLAPTATARIGSSDFHSSIVSIAMLGYEDTTMIH